MSLSGGRAFSHGRRRSLVSPRASRELVVGNQDQPCPPVGLLRCARPGAGETQCLLEKPEGVLDIETAEIGAPQQRQLDGGGIWVTEPQPQPWAEHAGQLPIVEGTIIHVAVDHLPGDRAPKPLWLWFGHPDAATVELTLLWRTYLRRFDIEHTFRFFTQTPGFTRARPRTPEQADRWAWLILVAYNQLRLARRLTEDLRLP